METLSVVNWRFQSTVRYSAFRRSKYITRWRPSFRGSESLIQKLENGNSVAGGGVRGSRLLCVTLRALW
jgi:hypothetical protein